MSLIKLSWLQEPMTSEMLAIRSRMRYGRADCAGDRSTCMIDLAPIRQFEARFNYLRNLMTHLLYLSRGCDRNKHSARASSWVSSPVSRSLPSMRQSRDTEPILPTTNMADTNGKSKDARKKVLVVGAGAAGLSRPSKRRTLPDSWDRHVMRSPPFATPRQVRCYDYRRCRLLRWPGILDTDRQRAPWS